MPARLAARIVRLYELLVEGISDDSGRSRIVRVRYREPLSEGSVRHLLVRDFPKACMKIAGSDFILRIHLRESPLGMQDDFRISLHGDELRSRELM